MARVEELFNSCKNQEISVASSVSKLINLFHKMEFEEFHNSLDKCIERILARGSKNNDLLFTIELLVQFVTSPEVYRSKNDIMEDESRVELEPSFYMIIRKILFYHNANKQCVRLQVCNLMNKILDLMPKGISIDSNLLDEIGEKMTSRLEDTSPTIRVKAIQTLSRLQDPSDNSCPIIEEYMKVMKLDLNEHVRCAVAKNLCLTNKTLPCFLERVKDARPLSRQTVYDRLRTSVPVRALRIAQRITVLKAGLSEKSQEVKKSFHKLLIDAWFNDACSSDFITFVNLFDVEEDKIFLSKILEHIITNLDIEFIEPHFKQISEWIDPESGLLLDIFLKTDHVFIWSNLIGYVIKNSNSTCSKYEHLIPEISSVCSLIERYFNQGTADQNIFILCELFSLLRNFELNDEAGRKTAIACLSRLLTMNFKIDVSIIKELVKTFMYYLANMTHKMDTIAEIVSEIRQPVLAVSQSRSSTGMDCDNISGNLSPDSNIRTLACLTVLIEALRCSNVDITSPTSASILQSFVLPLVQDNCNELRLHAVILLSIFCVRFKLYAQKCIVLLVHIITLDGHEIKREAISAIFDIFTLYGFSVLNSEHVDQSIISEDKALEYLFNLLEGDDNLPYRSLVICGICKLILFRRVESAKALSILMISYLNSHYTEDKQLKNILDNFFNLYHNKNYDNEHHILLDASIETLKELATNSDYSGIASSTVVNLLSNLSQPSDDVNTGEKNSSLRERFTLRTLNEILSLKEDDFTKYAIKILSYFHYFVNTENGLTQAETAMESIKILLNERNDYRSLKNLQKIEDRLSLRSIVVPTRRSKINSSKI